MPTPSPSLTDLQALLEAEQSRWSLAPPPSWSTWLSDVTLLAQRLTRMPVAFVSVVDRRTTTFLAVQGLDELPRTPREDTLCDLVARAQAPIVVPDTAGREDLARYPTVQAGMRSYVGVPVGRAEGDAVAFALCVADLAPHADAADAVEPLEALARLALRGLTAER